MNAEQELIKLSNYCLQHEHGIDTVWVGKVIEGIRTICASETAAKEAETARADRLAKELEAERSMSKRIKLL